MKLMSINQDDQLTELSRWAIRINQDAERIVENTLSEFSETRHQGTAISDELRQISSEVLRTIADIRSKYETLQ